MADLTSRDVLKPFSEVSAIKPNDKILFESAAGGDANKMFVSLFLQYLTKGILPKIGDDGTWYVGDTQLIGQDGKPIYATSFKYVIESESAYQSRPVKDDDCFYFRYED